MKFSALFALAGCASLMACASSPSGPVPPPYAVPAAPSAVVAPPGPNGSVTPSYGGNYNPVSGTRNSGGSSGSR